MVVCFTEGQVSSSKPSEPSTCIRLFIGMGTTKVLKSSQYVTRQLLTLHSMLSRVYETVWRPSIRLFAPSFDSRCGGFTDNSPARRTSIDSGGRRCRAAWRTAANAGSVTLTAKLAMPRTDFCIILRG